MIGQQARQCFFQTFCRLIIVRPLPLIEQFVRQPFRLGDAFRQINRPQSENRFRVFAFRQFVQDVPHFMQPSKLLFGLIPYFRQRRPKSESAVRRRQRRFIHPAFFKSVKTSNQLSVDSRNPSRSANRCFFPVISTPMITSKHRFSSAIPAFR